MEGLLIELDYFEPNVMPLRVMGDYDRVFGTGQTLVQGGPIELFVRGAEMRRPPVSMVTGGVRHLGFTHGYHSGRGNHGNGACCHGNRLGCKGNIGPSASRDQDGGHVTRDTRDRPW